MVEPNTHVKSNSGLLHNFIKVKCYPINQIQITKAELIVTGFISKYHREAASTTQSNHKETSKAMQDPIVRQPRTKETG